MTRRRGLVGLWLAAPLLLASAETTLSPAIGRQPAETWPEAVVALLDATAPLDHVYNGQFCGGVLVATRTVATAAHCVADRPPEQVHVLVGANNLCRGAPIDGKRVPVTAIRVHAHFEPASARYDYALLDIENSHNRSPARLGDAEEAQILAAYGWGRHGAHGRFSCTLMTTALVVRAEKDCQRALSQSARPFDPSSMFCADPLYPGFGDTCLGDSGGPVFAVGADKRAVVGLVSWGLGCDAGVPGVYAKISQRLEQAVTF